MTRIFRSLVSLFWWLVFHVLLLVNFVRFCLILLFGDLSVTVVRPPIPANKAQALKKKDPGWDEVGDTGLKDATPVSLCPVQTGQPAVPLVPMQAPSQHHPARHTEHASDTQTLPTVDSSSPSEQENFHADRPYTSSPKGEIQREVKPPPDEILDHSPPSRSRDGLSKDDLRWIVPCWDRDHITGEGSTCPTPSVCPSNVGTDVVQKVMRRAEDVFYMSRADQSRRFPLRAIHLLDHVIPFTPHDMFLAVCLDIQARCRGMLFDQTQDISLLDWSIDAFHAVLGLPAWNPGSRSATLTQCGEAYVCRHRVTGDSEDLDRGIALLRKGLEEPVWTGGRDPLVVAQLGDLLVKRHGRSSDDGDLNDGIHFLSKALSLLTADHPKRPDCLATLAHALTTRYGRSGRISDAQEAIVHYREVLPLLSHNHPDRPAILNDLARTLRTRYNSSGDFVDLEEAIVHAREALSRWSGSHPDRPVGLNSLANALYNRYEKLRNISDVEEAIGLLREALLLPSGDHQERSANLNTLATVLIARWDRLRNILDLEEGFVHVRAALSLRSGNHPDRPSSLNNMAYALRTRYKAFGDISDLEEAIVHLRETVSWHSGSHPNRPIGLYNLANALDDRYKKSGNTSDVEEIIALLRETLPLLCGSHPRRLSSRDLLAKALYDRYRRLGKISDVEEAIIYYREILSLQSTNDPGRPDTLNNLANVLFSRYMRLENTSDLDEAIDLLGSVCNTSEGDTVQVPDYLHNLANFLHLRKKGTSDLNDAIRLYEQALSLRPANDPRQPTTQWSLGKALLTRKQDASEVDTGFRHIEESLSSLPSHVWERQTALLNFLQMTLEFQRPINKTILRDRCIELAMLTPPDDAQYSDMASLVAPILYVCEETTPELLAALGLEPGLNVEEASLALLEKGSRSTAGLPYFQLRSTCSWITASEKFERPQSLEMYGRMLEQLDLVVASGCSLDIRRQQISTYEMILTAKRMVSDAVAFAIKQGAVETAVGFFERGQSILLAQLSVYRVSSGLETVAPDLADRFEYLSSRVERATFTEGKGLVDTSAKHPFEDPISRSARLRREWENVVEEIRALDGFRHFLRPTPYPDLKKAAEYGPVILVNISNLRSDAIIVLSQHPPAIVPLPMATPDSVKSLVASFKVGSDAYGPLRLLWEEIVEPVVSSLEAMQDPVPKGSRIWWCPTGALTTLPLHAAGDYNSRTGRRLPDLYISSYTPTLSALSRARQGREGRPGVPDLLLVGQSHTPGHNSLPAVPEEIARIRKRMPHATVMEDERGTRDAVLSAVTQHHWIHLSCHGNVKRDNPLQSHFALHDGPLSLHELMQKRLPGAELAFLSCCHSASGNSAIPDEFLNLAAGMQFAGFKSVVGTMWAMNDAVGPPLADEFYRRLLGRGKGDYRQSAKALNDALKVLRRDGVPPAIWINFVHWGA